MPEVAVPGDVVFEGPEPVPDAARELVLTVPDAEAFTEDEGREPVLTAVPEGRLCDRKPDEADADADAKPELAPVPVARAPPDGPVEYG